MKKHLFALALLTPLLVITTMLAVWGEEGPYYAVEDASYSLKGDGTTGLAWWGVYGYHDTVATLHNGIVAKDLAEAMNQAHEKRMFEKYGTCISQTPNTHGDAVAVPCGQDKPHAPDCGEGPCPP